MIDDSALLHGGAYDPAKAREYYLRTRELKGRRPGGTTPPTGGRPRATPSNNVQVRDSRQPEIAAQKAALEKRIDHLREVLADLVAKAKKRAGDSGDSKSSSKGSKDGKGGGSEKDSKSSPPLTAAQKREKAAKARKEYKKEDHSSDSPDLEQLREQIRDIRAKLATAIEDARKLSAKSTSKTAPKRR